MQQISIQKSQEHLTRVEGMNKKHPSDRMKRTCTIAELRLDWLKWHRDVATTHNHSDSWSCCEKHKQLYAQRRKLATRAQNVYIPSDTSVQYLSPAWWRALQYPTEEEFEVID